MQLLILIYQEQIRPLATRFDNRLELFNEIIIMLACYILLMFTDFYDNQEIKYFILGYALIILTIVLIVVNIVVVTS
jgi:hypothetical protein